MSVLNTCYFTKSSKKSNFGKRKSGVSILLLPSEHSGDTRTRLGKRGSTSFQSSTLVPSGKREVKKCLFKVKDIENQDPDDENALDSSPSSSDETPDLKYLYPKERRNINKSNPSFVISNKRFCSVLNSSNDIKDKEKRDTLCGNFSVNNQRKKGQCNLTKKQRVLQEDWDTPYRADYGNSSLNKGITFAGKARFQSPIPFGNSNDSTDSFPDLETRELMRTNEEWSVFKKPAPLNGVNIHLKKNHSVTSNENFLRKTLLDKDGDTLDTNELKEMYSIKKSKISSKCSDTILSSEELDTSLLPHRYTQYTKEGLKSPEAPQSCYNSFMKKMWNNSLVEEHELVNSQSSYDSVKQEENSTQNSGEARHLSEVFSKERIEQRYSIYDVSFTEIENALQQVRSSSKKKLSEIPEETSPNSYVQDDIILKKNSEINSTKYDVMLPENDTANQTKNVTTNPFQINRDTEIKSELTNILYMVKDFVNEKNIFDQRQQEMSRKLDSHLKTIVKSLNDLVTRYSLETPQEINILSQNLSEILRIFQPTLIN